MYGIPLVAPLAEDFKVIAVDLRGHGESERPAAVRRVHDGGRCARVADAAGAIDPLLVGHSLGGAVVSIYAATYPTRGVVNIDQIDAARRVQGHAHEHRADAPRRRRRRSRRLMNQIITGELRPAPASERARIEAGSSLEQDVVLGVWDLVFSEHRRRARCASRATVERDLRAVSRVARRRSRPGRMRNGCRPHRGIDARGLAGPRPLPAPRRAGAVPRSAARLRTRRRRAVRVLVTTPSALGHVNPVIPARAGVRAPRRRRAVGHGAGFAPGDRGGRTARRRGRSRAADAQRRNTSAAIPRRATCRPRTCPRTCSPRVRRDRRPRDARPTPDDRGRLGARHDRARARRVRGADRRGHARHPTRRGRLRRTRALGTTRSCR